MNKTVNMVLTLFASLLVFSVVSYTAYTFGFTDGISSVHQYAYTLN